MLIELFVNFYVNQGIIVDDDEFVDVIDNVVVDFVMLMLLLSSSLN